MYDDDLTRSLDMRERGCGSGMRIHSSSKRTVMPLGSRARGVVMDGGRDAIVEVWALDNNHELNITSGGGGAATTSSCPPLSNLFLNGNVAIVTDTFSVGFIGAPLGYTVLSSGVKRHLPSHRSQHRSKRGSPPYQGRRN
jgi:hypothetical protein